MSVTEAATVVPEVVPATHQEEPPATTIADPAPTSEPQALTRPAETETDPTTLSCDNCKLHNVRCQLQQKHGRLVACQLCHAKKVRCSVKGLEAVLGAEEVTPQTGRKRSGQDSTPRSQNPEAKRQRKRKGANVIEGWAPGNSSDSASCDTGAEDNFGESIKVWTKTGKAKKVPVLGREDAAVERSRAETVERPETRYIINPEAMRVRGESEIEEELKDKMNIVINLIGRAIQSPATSQDELEAREQLEELLKKWQDEQEK